VFHRFILRLAPLYYDASGGGDALDLGASSSLRGVGARAGLAGQGGTIRRVNGDGVFALCVCNLRKVVAALVVAGSEGDFGLYASALVVRSAWLVCGVCSGSEVEQWASISAAEGQSDVTVVDQSECGGS